MVAFIFIVLILNHHTQSSLHYFNFNQNNLQILLFCIAQILFIPIHITFSVELEDCLFIYLISILH